MVIHVAAILKIEHQAIGIKTVAHPVGVWQISGSFWGRLRWVESRNRSVIGRHAAMRKNEFRSTRFWG